MAGSDDSAMRKAMWTGDASSRFVTVTMTSSPCSTGWTMSWMESPGPRRYETRSSTVSAWCMMRPAKAADMSKTTAPSTSTCRMTF